MAQHPGRGSYGPPPPLQYANQPPQFVSAPGGGTTPPAPAGYYQQPPPSGYYQQPPPSVAYSYSPQFPPSSLPSQYAYFPPSQTSPYGPSSNVPQGLGPVALIPQMVAPQDVELTLKPDSDYKVKGNGSDMLRVKDHTWSSKKDVSTLQDQLLFIINPRSTSREHSCDFETASGKILLNVAIRGFFKTKREAHFRNAMPPYDDVTLSLQEKGEKKVQVLRNAQAVIEAVVEQHYFHKDEIKVRVKAGLDQALAVGLIVALYAEKKKAQAIEAAGEAAGAGA